MKVVILCGGRGTRMREETEYRPKPLVYIGDRPIIWHIMKRYAKYGFKDFILCLGYKGDMIKQYFNEIAWRNNDYTISIKNGKSKIEYLTEHHYDWNITMLNTGLETMTGGRIKQAAEFIQEEEFFMTYGDGVSNIDIKKLYEFHKNKGKKATLTGVHPTSTYGIIDVHEGIARSFVEKPEIEGFINGGFMVLNKGVLDYFPEDDCMFVDKPLKNIASGGELAIYKHDGYWSAIDTFKDVQKMNNMWNNGNRPWMEGIEW